VYIGLSLSLGLSLFVVQLAAIAKHDKRCPLFFFSRTQHRIKIHEQHDNGCLTTRWTTIVSDNVFFARLPAQVAEEQSNVFAVRYPHPDVKCHIIS